MQSLIVLLGLIAETLKVIVSTDSYRTEKTKQKVVSQLADTVIQIDRVLARAEIILSYIDRVTSTLNNEVEMKRLINTLYIQIDEVESLLEQVASLWSLREEDITDCSEGQNYAAPTRVIAIFGDKDFDLPKILAGKRHRLYAMLTLMRKSLELSEDKKLIANQYVVEDDADSEDRILLSWHLSDKTTKSEINLSNKNKRNAYLRMIRKELHKIDQQRILIKKLVRENFDVKDIL
jgi:hypothetical protein